ncbi:MAG TPA: sporulation membrane protein YtaF [Bacillota bacterium]|nr:sporulation membrane protein YtaF [Bacillota bacterium]
MKEGIGSMLYFAGLFFLVIAVSLDGFTVGLAYGMQHIRIPLTSLAIIMGLSGTIVLISMVLGSFIHPFISPEVTSRMGGVILIILGLFSLYNVLNNKQNKTQTDATDNNKFPNIRSILIAPEKVDLDQSGTISFNESLLLGTALSLDAFGAGFAAAMLNYSPLLTTLLIATLSGLFVFSGMSLGEYLIQRKSLQKMAFAPGLLLIILGLITCFN